MNVVKTPLITSPNLATLTVGTVERNAGRGFGGAYQLGEDAPRVPGKRTAFTESTWRTHRVVPPCAVSPGYTNVLPSGEGATMKFLSTFFT